MFDVMGLGIVEVMRLVGLVWEMRLLEALLGLRERVCDGERLGECGDTLLGGTLVFWFIRLDVFCMAWR